MIDTIMTSTGLLSVRCWVSQQASMPYTDAKMHELASLTADIREEVC